MAIVAILMPDIPRESAGMSLAHANQGQRVQVLGPRLAAVVDTVGISGGCCR